MSPDVNYNPLPEKDKDDKGGYEDYGSWEKENDRYENRAMEAEPMPGKETPVVREKKEAKIKEEEKLKYDYDDYPYDDYDYDYDRAAE